MRRSWPVYTTVEAAQSTIQYGDSRCRLEKNDPQGTKAGKPSTYMTQQSSPFLAVLLLVVLALADDDADPTDAELPPPEVGRSGLERLYLSRIASCLACISARRFSDLTRRAARSSSKRFWSSSNSFFLRCMRSTE